MISSWKRRVSERRRGATGKNNNDDLDINQQQLDVEELAVPTHFRCPISLDMMKDPVTLSTGITYDRDSIERWIESGNKTCPLTNQVLTSFDQIPNHALRKMIQFWCVENRSHGIERIPTPRIPVTPYEVSSICSKINVATQRGDQKRCIELVGKIKSLGKESERNKRCIKENGTTSIVLLAMFESFSNVSIEKHSGLLEEILSVLTWTMSPSHSAPPQDVLLQFTPPPAMNLLRGVAWFLKSGDLSARQSAVLVLKHLLGLDQRHAIALAEIDGVMDALFEMIKEPISPTATKGSLVAISHMISSPKSASTDKIVSRFVELGLVPLVLETLVDAQRGICEKALLVLENICNYKDGQQEACNHALITPVLVKKILRVSDLATELSVSILWKLCGCNNEKKMAIVVEALQVGGFQKILVLLQVGCGEETKHKVTGLLKLMNRYKHRVDCFDSSMAFNYLKRPF